MIKYSKCQHPAAVLVAMPICAGSPKHEHVRGAYVLAPACATHGGMLASLGYATDDLPPLAENPRCWALSGVEGNSLDLVAHMVGRDIAKTN